MGEYYMNSRFTVAAVSAPDDSAGCFSKRDMLKVTPCPMSIRLPKSDSCVGWAGLTHGFSRLTFGDDPSDKKDGFQRPPLWQRAWVVQERLLSTRMLQSVVWIGRIMAAAILKVRWRKTLGWSSLQQDLRQFRPKKPRVKEKIQAYLKAVVNEL
jgi:hypothetical protein